MDEHVREWERAMNALVMEHYPFCHHLSRRVVGPDYQQVDDTAHEIAVKFVEASRLFDRSRGVKLSSYATRFAVLGARHYADEQKRRGIRCPRHAAHKTDRPNFRSVPLASGGGEGDRESIDVAEREPEEQHEPAPNLWGQIAAVLSPKAMRVLRLRYVDGWTLEQIGDKIGVTREAVRIGIRSSLRKIQQQLPHLQKYL